MRKLTFEGFLKKYVAELAGVQTASVHKLADCMIENPRLKEPLFLYGGHRRHGFWHSKLSAQPQPESASGSGAAPSGLPLTPEHPDAQIIDGVLPAYDVPESALSDYLRPDWSDACINVRTEEAYETAHEVLRAEGLFLGTSAAAALHAAVQVGRRPENQGKNIVVIVPDNGMKYLSTPMYRQK